MTTKTGLVIHLVAKIAWAALFVSGLIMTVFGQTEKGAVVFVLGTAMWVATKAISEGLSATQLLLQMGKKDKDDSEE